MNDDVMRPCRYWADGSRPGRLVPTTGLPTHGGRAEVKDCHALDWLLVRREGLARKHQLSRPGGRTTRLAPPPH